MAHFAKIENGIVTEVIVINNESLNNLEFPESESVGQEFIYSLGLEGNWLQTSYNSNFRGRYASPGMKYDESTDTFISNEENLDWELVPEGE